MYDALKSISSQNGVSLKRQGVEMLKNTFHTFTGWLLTAHLLPSLFVAFKAEMKEGETREEGEEVEEEE